MQDDEIRENAAKENEVKDNIGKHTFFKGSMVGVLSTLLVVTIVFSTVWKMGFLNVGTDGTIYVQDQPIDQQAAGIGSDAENKLNVLEQALDSFYFDNVDENVVLDNIYKAYLNSFGDKYTIYYTAEEYKAIKESTAGTYSGIGVLVTKTADAPITIVRVYDGPGKTAGLQADDLITKVNGVSVLERDLTAVTAEIKGVTGTTVDVEVVREGAAAPIQMTIERQPIEVPTVDWYMAADDIGYIQISEFDQVTAAQFDTACQELKQQGMKGLVIDIRSNPGGLLSTVVQMLDKILPNGMIVYTEDKNGKRVEYKGNNSEQIDIPLAVLVNGHSASASEIFAGAVQDYGVGRIIGTQTFGKGIVQTIRPLSDGSAVKFTTSKYFTAKGQDIHGNGVTPDEVIEESEEFKALQEYDEAADNQLQAAYSYVKSQINLQ